MNRMPRSLLIGWAVLCLVPAILSAQTAAQPSYHDYQGMRNALQRLVDGYPDLLSLASAGETLQGRSVDVVTLTAGGQAETKPAVLVAGGVEGTDIAASELCLEMIRSLAAGYGRSDSIARVLEHTTLYFFPRVNPDATEAFFASPRYERTLNTRPMDLDRDGTVDEDGYDDLNGDGFITLMRIPDPTGEWMPDPENPRLMRKADPEQGEAGVYRILPEGRDNDGDGEFNEDEPGGVDFNRNFTFGYTYFQKGAGPHQVSERETRAVADFAFAHKNIAAVFSFSPDDNLLHPWESKREGREAERSRRTPVTSVLPADAAYYRAVGEKFRAVTGLSDSPAPQEGHGEFSKWAYYHYGRWSFSVPAWWPPRTDTTADSGQVAKPDSNTGAGREGRRNGKDPLAAQRRLLAWLESTGQTDAFVEWTAVTHPDFPDTTVEVGGFRPYVAQNPPPDSLAGRSTKYSAFLVELGGLLPRIKLKQIKVEALRRNVYRVTLVIANPGFLPTSSRLGDRNKWAPRVKVAIATGEDQQVASGRTMQLVDAIPGSGGSREFQWVVTGARGSRVTLTAGSPMTGSVQRTVELR